MSLPSLRWFVLPAVWLAAAADAGAAACPLPITSNQTVVAFPVGGACALADGTALSNFRAAAAASGGATVPTNIAGLGDSSGTTTLSPFVDVGAPAPFASPGSGTIILQYAYTLAAAAGRSFTTVQNSGSVGQSTTTFAGHSQSMYFCAGGVFSSLPAAGAAPSASSCSGTLIPVTTPGATAAIAPVPTIDVYAAISVGGTIYQVTGDAGFATTGAPGTGASVPALSLVNTVLLGTLLLGSGTLAARFVAR